MAFLSPAAPPEGGNASVVRKRSGVYVENRQQIDRPTPVHTINRPIGSAQMYRLYAMVILSAAVVACGGGEQRQPAATPAERLELGVVAIGARIGDDAVRSSGIVIDGAAGLVITTAHSVWGARSLKLATQLGVLHGRIVARAPCDDLAVIETYPRIPGLVAPAPAPSSSPTAGQLLRSVGRRRVDPDSAFGFVSIPVRATGPAAGGMTALDSPLVPEVSGGAVLDEANRLVGMAMPHESGTGRTFPWATIPRRLQPVQPRPRQVYVGSRPQ